ncbi:hypothetical protein JXA27_06995 [Aerococcaceae bacterium zg-B36]|uniref:hypothetical protein n=1 Tax=Aerococcaceae bacterium zg-252 TaxID=2796928 RepID=UPI001BD8DBC6|nr:hypothetical protein [Aerococcaceae bacterium zg-B36]
MATKFQEIYPLFLSQIDDYEMSQLEDNELEVLIKPYLLVAIITCQRTISDIDEVNEEEEYFEKDLTLQEKILLAKAMKLEWIREKKFNLELMRKSLGDRDYKAIQGTDYLKELTNVEATLRKEVTQELIEYTYSKNDFWNDLFNG